MDDTIKDKYNRLFYYFEENIFENDGAWSRTLNLVFAFSDWLNELPDHQFIELTGLEDVKQAKAEMQHGIDVWLEQNHKNLF